MDVDSPVDIVSRYREALNEGVTQTPHSCFIKVSFFFIARGRDLLAGAILSRYTTRSKWHHGIAVEAVNKHNAAGGFSCHLLLAVPRSPRPFFSVIDDEVIILSTRRDTKKYKLVQTVSGLGAMPRHIGVVAYLVSSSKE